MTSSGNHEHGNTKDAARPRSASVGRRDLMKGSIGMAAAQALGSEVKAAGATRKIALEEQFSTPGWRSNPYEDTQIAATFIESVPISEAVRAKVCHGNAQRILKL
jgi:hypothetical protein